MTERPVWEMLQAAAGRHSGHMPGHKGRAPFGNVDLYALDTTELPVTDDLYSAERGLRRAEELYAAAAGAGASLFLHNGSTSGIHVMLQLYAHEGEIVLLPRNAHMSAVNACVLGGVRVVWMPVTQRADGYCYLREETVLQAIAEHPEAKALLITRPDFFGGCIPMQRIMKKAHENGLRVVVDEAHGAHFPWLDGNWSAGALGADAWVQSVHKTIPGLTGSAVLQLRDANDAPAAMRILRREQTSSPSFILMQSIDDARALMEENGRQDLQQLKQKVHALQERLPLYGYRDAHVLWAETGLDFDPTRLVIDAPQGGHLLADALQEHGIDVEMADQRRCVLILTSMTTEEDLRAIENALAAIKPEQAELPPLPDVTALPEKALEVRTAAMAEGENVPLCCAAGRIAAQAAGLYPPGIPQICPGERIPQSVTEMLMKAGAQQRFGVEEDTIWCVKQ